MNLAILGLLFPIVGQWALLLTIPFWILLLIALVVWFIQAVLEDQRGTP